MWNESVVNGMALGAGFALTTKAVEAVVWFVRWYLRPWTYDGLHDGR